MTGPESPVRNPLIPAVRAAAAAVLSYGISAALGLPESHWAALSALIVGRPLPGAATRAGTDRLVGTLLGGTLACAAVTLRVFAIPELALLAGTLAPLVLAAARKEGWRTAPVAAVIVLSAAPDGHGALEAALLRIAEVAIGAVCGVAAAWILLPSSTQREAAALGGRALALLEGSLAAAEAGEWTAGETARRQAQRLALKLTRLAGAARWERIDRDGIARLQAALARLNHSTAFALRAMRDRTTGTELLKVRIAADYAAQTAHRDARALESCLAGLTSGAATPPAGTCE